MTRKPSRPCPGNPAARLSLVQLEDRSLPSTFTVTNLNDAGPGSLRAAVVAANATPAADTIQFKNGLKGTITLASELGITEDLRIDGPSGNKITISGGNATRVFRISGATTDVIIDDLKIVNGLAQSDPIPGPFGDASLGGGILNVEGNLTLDGVAIMNNRALGGDTTLAGGGGVANIFGARLTVTDSTFSGNAAVNAVASAGGAIYNDAGSDADIRHSQFTNNRASGDNTFGGAIESAASSLAVSDSTFIGNVSEAGAAGGVGFGGAINVEPFGSFVLLPSSASIDSSVFLGNRAVGGTDGEGPGGIGFGGAVALNTSGAAATVSDSTFAGNLAQGGNGGPGSPGGEGNGGSIGVTSFFGFAPSAFMVSGSTFAGNKGRGGDGGTGAAGGLSFGGAIVNIGSTLAVGASSFVGNEARGGVGVGSAAKAAGLGGAIGSTAASGTLATTDVTDAAFIGNRAVGGDGVGGSPGHNGAGGGIFNINSVLTLDGGLFVGNQAVGGAGGVGGLGLGGGVYNGSNGTAFISRTALIGNQAVGGTGTTMGGNGQGGGLYNGGGTGIMTVANTAVLANRAVGGSGATAGTGTGGGVYNDALIVIDPLSLVALNSADAFDNVFGYP